LDAKVAEAEASAQTLGGVTLTRQEHEHMKMTACTAIGVCQANGMTQVRSEYSALVAECGDATWNQNGRIGDAYAVATKDVNIFSSKVGHRGTYLSHRCEDWFE
jgi:carbon monoxide dehydrogenase subunit G